MVDVTDTTAARRRHTPTKLLPITSPKPNPNTSPNPNPNPNPNPKVSRKVSRKFIERITQTPLNHNPKP